MRINWKTDEIILVADLVAANDWRALGPHDPSVIELSVLLQSPAIHPLVNRDASFRNPNGVGRKSSDIATRHPGYTGKPTNGNRLDREVLSMFLLDPEEMRLRAASIRELLSAGEFLSIHPENDFGVAEGGLLMSVHWRRERDRGLRARKIRAVKEAGGSIECEVCNMDFAIKYGERGADFIEVHHAVPLHVSGAVKTKLADLVLLCSNCHRMIHREPWLMPAKLKAIVESSHLR